MATPATARRSEPSSTRVHAEFDVPSSPVRTIRQLPSRTSTPRPSISPLSTASRAAKNSPIATRDATVADIIALNETTDGIAGHQIVADTGDVPDDASSSLSEPEDDVQDEDMENDGAKERNTLLASQILAKDLDADSDAETERLEQTPRKLRAQNDTLGRTPSKLRDAAVVAEEDELSEPPSPLPTGVGAASSTSTIGAVGKKRKRSDAEDSPLTSEDDDLRESLRKRSNEYTADVTVGVQEEAINTNGAADVAQNEEPTDETPMLDITQPTTKGFRGRKGKPKGKKVKSPAEVVDAEKLGEANTGSTIPNLTTEDTATKSEATTVFADLAKQFHAFRDRLYAERIAAVDAELQLLAQPNSTHPEYLRQVACIDARRAKQTREAHAYNFYRSGALKRQTLGERAQKHSQFFQTVRETREDVLYNLGEDWYALQKERRQQGLSREEEEKYVYKFQPKRSLQIRQQAKYNQEVSVLAGVAKHVGFPAAPDTNGADGDQMDDDLKAMRIPRRAPPQPAHHPPAHVHAHPYQAPQQAPAPPPAPLPPPPPQQQHTHTVSLPNRATATSSTFASNERLAHEQFIEQNAWARAPHPSSAHAAYGQHVGTPNLTHTPDWAEPATGAGRGLGRFTGIGMHAAGRASPFATPISVQKNRFGGDQSREGSEPNAQLSAAAQQERLRIQQQLQREREEQQMGSSPLTVPKQRRDLNGDRERELTGFRNFSNLSGTSTIDAPLEGDSSIHEDKDRETDGDSAKRHVFAGLTPAGTAGLRVAEGGFGTPTPGLMKG